MASEVVPDRRCSTRARSRVRNPTPSVALAEYPALGIPGGGVMSTSAAPASRPSTSGSSTGGRDVDAEAGPGAADAPEDRGRVAVGSPGHQPVQPLGSWRPRNSHSSIPWPTWSP